MALDRSGDPKLPGIPLIIAHRGASLTCAENTLEAFREAHAQGADMVELDVHLAADGVLAIHHDPTLSDGRTLWEMARSAFPEGLTVLEDALAACEGMDVNIEIKSEGPWAEPEAIDEVIERCLTVIEGRPAGQSIVFSSFNLDVLAEIRARRADARLAALGWLFDGDAAADRFIDRAIDLGCEALNPWAPDLTEHLRERAEAQGLGINVWTIDGDELVNNVLDRGATGIITNDPAGTRAAVQSRLAAQSTARPGDTSA